MARVCVASMWRQYHTRSFPALLSRSPTEGEGFVLFSSCLVLCLSPTLLGTHPWSSRELGVVEGLDRWIHKARARRHVLFQQLNLSPNLTDPPTYRPTKCSSPPPPSSSASCVSPRPPSTTLTPASALAQFPAECNAACQPTVDFYNGCGAIQDPTEGMNCLRTLCDVSSYSPFVLSSHLV